jgi:hypothetical protein
MMESWSVAFVCEIYAPYPTFPRTNGDCFSCGKGLGMISNVSCLVRRDSGAPFLYQKRR